jgi:hypothetical protein
VNFTASLTASLPSVSSVASISAVARTRHPTPAPSPQPSHPTPVPTSCSDHAPYCAAVKDAYPLLACSTFFCVTCSRAHFCGA